MTSSRKFNNTPRKDDILKLRKAGKSYREIQSILGCSKSTIAYHCDGGKEKKRVERVRKEANPICKKVSNFKSRCSRSNYEVFRGKLKTFKRKTQGVRYNRNHALVNSIKVNYSCQDVIDRIGESPVCYLTGFKIDLNKPDTYNLDHVAPTAHGGSNDLDNLNVCLKEANQAKGELSLDQLYELCENILSWRDEQPSSVR